MAAAEPQGLEDLKLVDYDPPCEDTVLRLDKRGWVSVSTNEDASDSFTLTAEFADQIIEWLLMWKASLPASKPTNALPRLCFADDTDTYYFDDEVEVFIEKCEEDGIEHVWSTAYAPFSVDIDTKIDDVMEDHYDGVIVQKRAEAVAFFKIWNAAQTDGTYWKVKKVPLQEARDALAAYQNEQKSKNT